jgi:hypothetical protein
MCIHGRHYLAGFRENSGMYLLRSAASGLMTEGAHLSRKHNITRANKNTSAQIAARCPLNPYLGFSHEWLDKRFFCPFRTR